MLLSAVPMEDFDLVGIFYYSLGELSEDVDSTKVVVDRYQRVVKQPKKAINFISRVSG